MAVRDARRVALAWALLVGAAEGGVRPNSASQRPLRAVARPASAAAAAVGHPPPAPPDAHTLLSRCREHVRAGDAHSALAEFRRMLRCGRPCVRSCNQLLLQLADAGQLNAAVEAYRAMLAAGQPAPTAVTYSTLISRAARAHDRPLAESLFAEMLEIGCQPDTQVYNSAIQACAKAGDPEAALRYASDLRARGLQPTAVTFNSLLDAFARTGNVTAMLATFRSMKQSRLTPDGMTFSIVINGCARAERVNAAFAVLGMMRRANLPPNAITYSTLIHACGKTNQLNRALETLAEMERDGIRPNVVTWTALIDAHGKGEQPEAALWLFGRMEASGVQPNEVTLDVLFNALMRAGQLERAVRVLQAVAAGGSLAAAAGAAGEGGGAAGGAAGACLRVTGRMYTTVLRRCMDVQDVVQLEATLALMRADRMQPPVGLREELATFCGKTQQLAQAFDRVARLCAGGARDVDGADESGAMPAARERALRNAVALAVEMARASATGARLLLDLVASASAVESVHAANAPPAAASSAPARDALRLARSHARASAQAARRALDRLNTIQRLAPHLADTRDDLVAAATAVEGTATALDTPGATRGERAAGERAANAPPSHGNDAPSTAAVSPRVRMYGAPKPPAVSQWEELVELVTQPAHDEGAGAPTRGRAARAAERPRDGRDAISRVFAVFRQMVDAGVPPDVATFNVLLGACAVAGDVPRALRTLQTLRAAGHVPDVITYTSLIKAYGKAGLVDGAEAVFAAMLGAREPARPAKAANQKKNHLLDRLAANPAAAAAAFAPRQSAPADMGGADEAAALVRAASHVAVGASAVRPNEFTYAELMRAQLRAGNDARVVELYALVRAACAGRPLKPRTLNLALRAQCALGELKPALRLRVHMRANGVEEDAHARHALDGLCVACRQPGLGARPGVGAKAGVNHRPLSRPPSSSRPELR